MLIVVDTIHIAIGIPESEAAMLEGFTIINPKRKEDVSEVCKCTINSIGITFTAQTVKNMNHPENVLIGVNAEKKEIGFAVNVAEPRANSFLKSKGHIIYRIGAGQWRDEVSQMMPDWDLKTFNYRVDGRFNEDHTEMVFDLTTAKQCEKRKRTAKIYRRK